MSEVLFAFILLIGFFLFLRKWLPSKTVVDRAHAVLIALFAFIFLVIDGVGVDSLKAWQKYGKRALKADYSSRYGEDYRNATGEIFPWYQGAFQARGRILARGEKSVRLLCPPLPSFRERIAVILYPVRIDPHARLTLKVSDPPRVRFRLIEDQP